MEFEPLTSGFTHKVDFGERSFSYFTPKFWNSLSQTVRHIYSTSSLKSALKTYLLKKYLDDYQLTPPWTLKQDYCRLCHSLAQHIFVSLWAELLPLQTTRKRNDVISTSTLNRFSWNFNTINRTKVPTFSPSLIKIRPIVSEI